MSRFFNLREAQELLPHVRAWLDEATAAKSAVEEIDDQIFALVAHITMAGGVEIDPIAVVRRKIARHQAAERARAALESIENAGCRLEDLDDGRVDFPALLDGKEVFLCWRRGEERIEFWRAGEDSSTGRRPIGKNFGDDPGGSRPN